MQTHAPLRHAQTRTQAHTPCSTGSQAHRLILRRLQRQGGERQWRGRGLQTCMGKWVCVYVWAGRPGMRVCIRAQRVVHCVMHGWLSASSHPARLPLPSVSRLGGRGGRPWSRSVRAVHAGLGTCGKKLLKCSLRVWLGLSDGAAQQAGGRFEKALRVSHGRRTAQLTLLEGAAQAGHETRGSSRDLQIHRSSRLAGGLAGSRAG
jgi:hypothetical protein